MEKDLCFLLTTLVVQVRQFFLCVCLCVRDVTLELNDLRPKHSVR